MAGRSNHSRLFRNVLSIAVFQASGYVLALINVPYLTRTLGVANYGVLAFAISINAYLWLLMDWGFSLGATGEIARANGNASSIRQIFWRTMTAKALLSLAALAVLFGVAGLSHVPNSFYIIFLPGAINILSAILTVDWLLQGLQRMGVFTLYSIGGRMLTVMLTFILVHGPDDTWIACCLQTFGGLLASAAGFLIVPRVCTIGKPTIDLRSSARQIWDYRHYFLVQSSWIAYSMAAPLLLTLVSGSIAVGLFAGAERIVRTAMSLTGPLSTAMYPHVNALSAKSQEAAANAAGLLLAAQVILGLGLFVVFMTVSQTLTVVILGVHFQGAIPVLRYLGVLPLLSGIGGTVLRQFLIPLGWRKSVSHLTVMGTGVYLVLLLVLGRNFGAVGAALALVATESMLAAAAVILLLRREREFAAQSFRAVLRVPRRFCLLMGRGPGETSPIEDKPAAEFSLLQQPP